jgi:hypothetical protein
MSISSIVLSGGVSAADLLIGDGRRWQLAVYGDQLSGIQGARARGTGTLGSFVLAQAEAAYRNLLREQWALSTSGPWTRRSNAGCTDIHVRDVDAQSCVCGRGIGVGDADPWRVAEAERRAPSSEHPSYLHTLSKIGVAKSA